MAGLLAEPGLLKRGLSGVISRVPERRLAPPPPRRQKKKNKSEADYYAGAKEYVAEV